MEVVVNYMRRTIKKDTNLNKLKTATSPSKSEAKKMEKKKQANMQSDNVEMEKFRDLE